MRFSLPKVIDDTAGDRHLSAQVADMDNDGDLDAVSIIFGTSTKLSALQLYTNNRFNRAF